jgi:hypothetical protein
MDTAHCNAGKMRDSGIPAIDNEQLIQNGIGCENTTIAKYRAITYVCFYRSTMQCWLLEWL